MKFNERIILFQDLGDFLTTYLDTEDFKELCLAAKNSNPWFTDDNIALAFKAIIKFYLNQEALNKFEKSYEPCETDSPKNIGLIAAGNIPLVGFHDLMMVVLSGNNCLIKLSQNDTPLMSFIISSIKRLNNTAPISIIDRLNDADVFIATGSDNSSRYFEYYFGKKPNIIRKNRVSVAILTGNESKKQLGDLGTDIFSYFGLGCRNVSKLYVPKGYDFVPFFEAIEYWSTISIHHKYNNNYDYNKSILLVNGIKHLDNGFLLVREDKTLVSPISVLFYEEYESPKELEKTLAEQKDKIQTIVGADKKLTQFGFSQNPDLFSFSDGVDTFAFLKELN